MNRTVVRTDHHDISPAQMLPQALHPRGIPDRRLTLDPGSPFSQVGRRQVQIVGTCLYDNTHPSVSRGGGDVTAFGHARVNEHALGSRNLAEVRCAVDRLDLDFGWPPIRQGQRVASARGPYLRLVVVQ